MLQSMLRRITFRCSNKIEKFGISSRIGGSSEDDLYTMYEGRYENKALMQYKKHPKCKQFGVNILTTPEECYKCVQILNKTDNIVAWDTETIDLDIKNQTPVGKGKIICASFFAGPEFDFGQGPKVFIDNFGQNAGLLNIFKEYLEDEKRKKVWHNYGFDRHVFYNHGIDVRGFAADTMHMARLFDSSKMFGEYSLAALTKSYAYGINKKVNMYIEQRKKHFQAIVQYGKDAQKQEYQKMINSLNNYTKMFSKSSDLKKKKMEHLFMRKKLLKSGEVGKTYEFPSVLTLHTSPEYIHDWVQYSVLDSQSTFFLREALQNGLINQKSDVYPGIKNTFDIYQKYWVPFGQLLTDMQREGFKIDLAHMKKIQQEAALKVEEKKKKFMELLLTFQDDQNIDYFNPSSHLQMQQLLHAPFKVQEKKISQIKKESVISEELAQLTKESPEDSSKGVGKKPNLTELPPIKTFKVENKDPERGKMRIDMNVKGLGIPPIKVTPNGLPSVDEESLHQLAGSPKKGKYGKAFEYFESIGEAQFGKKICQAIETLIQYRNTETLLQTFIQPLQTYADKNDRIHCSLNINTETGRLSARKPNLQNQPALEKDVYKIRSAFTIEKGNKLIVADYGQLELRVLAHLSNCTKMIQAFKQGGDFHSRTAIGMFDYIRKEIDEGTILLEWDKSKGDPPHPLLKQKYASERRKAKTVNFSIAYGKTAQGFAEDWNCSIEQAKNVIKAWFKDRPQVQKWQKNKQEIAKNKKMTQTLLGRYRNLHRYFSTDSMKGSLIGMGLRRSINTPIQGGAADIVIASMVNLHKNQRLKEIGWKLLMQIHDELILEGPEETSKQALQIVKHEMSHPFEQQLLVELEIDGKIGTTWYECK